MARIHPELIERIKTKRGIAKMRVYKLIEKKAIERSVPRHLAALLVAGDAGIGYQRFATPEQMAELRGTASPIVAPYPAASETKGARRIQPTPPKKNRDNSVFVVHGRDSKLNDAMYGFLRAIGLKPKEFSQVLKAAKGPNPNVGEAIYNGMEKAHGVVVLFSPDEEAKLKPRHATDKDKKYRLHELDGQARPNVIFEAGLALGAHAQKTILVQVGDTRDISDLAGKHIMHLSNDPATRVEFADRLKTKLGFKVEIDGKIWLSATSFDFSR